MSEAESSDWEDERAPLATALSSPPLTDCEEMDDDQVSPIPDVSPRTQRQQTTSSPGGDHSTLNDFSKDKVEFSKEKSFNVECPPPRGQREVCLKFICEMEEPGAVTEGLNNLHSCSPKQTNSAKLRSQVSHSAEYLDRQYSETPSWIELKKWKKQMDNHDLAGRSLHQLARDGNVKQVRESLDMTTSLVAMRKKINQFDADHLTPLHYAARYSHFPVVKLLVERGADIDIQGEDGVRPLHFAARYKRTKLLSPRTSLVDERRNRRLKTASWDEDQSDESQTRNRDLEVPIGSPSLLSTSDLEDLDTENIILYMVQHGADVNAQDFYGMCPLHYCAMRENVIVCQELLKCPAVVVDARDNQSMTPLHSACAHGSKEVAELLLKQGANIRATDDLQNTPLHLAAQDGYLGIVKLLVEFGSSQSGGDMVHAMLRDQDQDLTTPLLLAVDSGHYEVSKFLLQQGADPNTHRVMHDSALHAASVTGDVRILALLVEHGARIDCRNVGLQTALHRAASFDHGEVLDLLVEKGADLEARDNDGFTPFLVAACEDHPQTVTRLLLHGADIAALDRLDRNAIYLATLFENMETLAVLMKNEAAKELLDKGDRYMNTPLHIAAKNGFFNIARMLLDNGSKLDSKNEEEETATHWAAKNGRTRVVREFVRRSKLVVSDEDENSNTPLHVAAIAGHEMVCRELLSAGAKIAARNAVLWTPLDCAAAHGWERTAEFLLDNDAPVDAMDKSKTTPLLLASKAGHVDMVSLLLARGAKIDLTDHQGRNCLDLAIEHGHKAVATVIVHDRNWKSALRNARIDTELETRITPMRMLIKQLPEVASSVFDQCTKAEGRPEAANYRINFDWEFLDDTYSNWKPHQEDKISLSPSKDFDVEAFDEKGNLQHDARPYCEDSDILKENHPLMLMVHWERENLLNHPLVISLLRQKWNSYGRQVYYLALSIYIVFIAFLTAYMLRTPPTYNLYRQNASKNTNFEKVCNETSYFGNTRQKDVPFVSKWAILFLTVFHLLKEVFQMYQRKLNYFDWENMIEWTVYVGAFLLVFDFSDCTRITGIRTPWQWQLGSCCIFLAWMNLVLFIRKFPRFGIYVVMFTDILKTFSRFAVVFTLFIVAFSLGFFSLFQNQPQFQLFGSSLMKTTVMMIGEFEFDTIFNNKEEDVHYPLVAYPAFVCFIILMTILTMNLLVGLAVDDIKAVQEKAVLKRLAMQVELVLHVEQVLPEWLRRRWIKGKQRIYPNRRPKLKHFKTFIFGTPTQLSVRTIANHLNREQEEMEILKTVQEKTSGTVESMRKRMEVMQNQQERLHSMVSAVIQHFNINWEDQDEFRTPIN